MKQFLHKPKTHATDTELIRKLTDLYQEFEGDLTGRDLHKIGTTLDRIDKDNAIRLLARGYANMHAAAFCMNLIETHEITMTRERLELLTSPS